MQELAPFHEWSHANLCNYLLANLHLLQMNLCVNFHQKVKPFLWSSKFFYDGMMKAMELFLYHSSFQIVILTLVIREQKNYM
jgi:hypothetical protein